MMDRRKNDSRNWIVFEAARALWHKGRQNAIALPRQAWKAWLVTAGFGWIFVLLLMAAMVWGMQELLRIGIFTQEYETVWLNQINERSPMIFSDAVWSSAPGDPIIIIPIVIAAAVVAVRMGYPIHAVTILVSYFLVAAIVFVGWQMWDRTRPALVLNGVAAPAFNSFPSGHMAESTAFYSLLFYLWLRRSPYLSERIFGIALLSVWLGVIAIARLEMGTHWPTDVVAGTVIGLAWLWALIAALQRAEAVKSTKQATDQSLVDHTKVEQATERLRV